MRDYGAAFLQQTALRWMRRFHNRGRRHAGADARTAGVPAGAGLRQRGAPAARGRHRAVRSRAGATRRCARDWGLDDDGVAAIHVGRIAPEKNLDLAVRAFRALQQARARRRASSGSATARRAHSWQRDNPDFIFCGMQRGEALARHFASGDLFVFPSHSETFGNVTLEAMASGVPTVAFDYGAAREHLRDGVHGAAIADGDDAGFIARRAAASAATTRCARAMRTAARDAVSADCGRSRSPPTSTRILQSLANREAAHGIAGIA